MSYIALKNIHKSFGPVDVLKGVSFEVPAQKVTCLLGSSGCGKTTLLRIITGLEKPDMGVVKFQNEVWSGPEKFIAPEERPLGLVFQDYALFPHLTVEQNILFALTKDNKETQQKRLKEVQDLLDLKNLLKRYPYELSGGQQQRVALGRALAPAPALLLLDEPFSNLDVALRERLREDLVRVLKSTGVTTIFVTHDQEEALRLSDQIIVMKDGLVEHVGTPDEVYHAPKTLWEATFLGKASFIKGTLKSEKVLTELGTFDVSPDGNFLEGDEATVLLRPDEVWVAPEQKKNSLMCTLEKIYFGNLVRWAQLTTPEGQCVLACLPGNFHPVAGEKVAAQVYKKHAALFPHAQSGCII